MSESITQKQEQLALEPALADQVVNQLKDMDLMNDHQAVQETTENLGGDIINDRQIPILSATGPRDLQPNGSLGFMVANKLTLRPSHGDSSFIISDSDSLAGTPRPLAGTSYEWHRTGRWYVKNCGNVPITYECQ